MDFEKCIRRAIEEGKMRPELGERTLQRYENLKRKYAKAGNTEAGAAEAAGKLLEAERARALDKRRNVQSSILKIETIEQQFKNSKGTIFREFGKLLQAADFRQQSVRRTAYQFLDEVGETLRVSFTGTSKDHDLFADAVREATTVGGASVSKEAKKLGQAIRRVFEFLNARYKAAGGIMGTLENYFPQIHRAELIRAVSKEQWVEFILKGGSDGGPLVDISKMHNKATGMEFLSADELKPVLEDVYDDIVHGVRKSGRGDLDTRHARSRFLHFKDTDSFFTYNNRFGTGEKGLIQSFFGNIDSMSRDIGALETLGPRPNMTKEHFLARMEAEDRAAGSTLVNARKSIRRGEFNVLTSRFEQGDTQSYLYRAMAGTQNLLRSSLLGSASISALSDIGFAHATARLHGLSSTRIMRNFISHIRPGSSEAKVAARRFGLVMDIVNDTALDESRIAGETLGTGITAHLSRMTNKLSGLDRWTKSVKAAVTVEAATAVGEEIAASRAWGEIPAQLKESLEGAGITDVEWGHLIATRGHSELNGARVFIPMEYKAREFRNGGLEAGSAAAKIADKIDTWIDSLRQISTNEATLNTRAITTGAVFGDRLGGQGTMLRIAASSAGLFKTFPITVLTTHTGEIFRRASAGQKGLAFEHAFNTVVLTGILGVGVIQLKNLSRGKTTQDWQDPALWMAGMVQGGGAGILGDLLFGSGQTRFRRSPTEDLAGPTMGLLADTVNAAAEIPNFIRGEDNKLALDMFRIAKRNFIPAVGSLWYTRLLVERGLLDQLERIADPNFDKRMRKYEREMRKHKGQEFWWQP